MTHVQITSAVKLSTAQAGTITSAIEKKYGKTAECVFSVDPRVLGGISITVGSRQIDTTLRSKLDFAKQSILQRVSAE